MVTIDHNEADRCTKYDAAESLLTADGGPGIRADELQVGDRFRDDDGWWIADHVDRDGDVVHVEAVPDDETD